MKVNRALDKTIYWSPRVASLLFIAFLSLFAADIFEQYRGWEAILPLMIHLLPSFVLLLVVMVAWKYDLVGAVFFAAAAAAYVWMVGLSRPWSWYVSISGPALVVAVLYLLSWWNKSRIAGPGRGCDESTS